MSTTIPTAASPGLVAGAPSTEFYSQRIEMMKRVKQAPQHPQ